MKILFDTNVILDVILEREPFVEVASQLLAFVKTGEINGYLGATTITTISYLVEKSGDKGKAIEAIRVLCDLFEIAAVDRKVLRSALQLGFTDFEDAVLHEAGKFASVDGLVTRNGADFKNATLKIYEPNELYRLIKDITVPDNF